MMRRRGYALLELMAVMTLLATIFGLCVTTIHGLLRLDRAGRARVQEATALSRLGRQFRQDVRAASAGRSPGKDKLGAAVELTVPPDRIVTYRWTAGRLLRDERAPGRPEAHEAYRLPDRIAPRFQVLDESGIMWVTLEIDRKPDVARLFPARTYRAEARLGKDRLHVAAGGGDR